LRGVERATLRRGGHAIEQADQRRVQRRLRRNTRAPEPRHKCTLRRVAATASRVAGSPGPRSSHTARERFATSPRRASRLTALLASPRPGYEHPSPPRSSHLHRAFTPGFQETTRRTNTNAVAAVRNGSAATQRNTTKPSSVEATSADRRLFTHAYFGLVDPSSPRLSDLNLWPAV
jgi:hypothetical protein